MRNGKVVGSPWMPEIIDTRVSVNPLFNCLLFPDCCPKSRYANTQTATDNAGPLYVHSLLNKARFQLILK